MPTNNIIIYFYTVLASGKCLRVHAPWAVLINLTKTLEPNMFNFSISTFSQCYYQQDSKRRMRPSCRIDLNHDPQDCKTNRLNKSQNLPRTSLQTQVEFSLHFRIDLYTRAKVLTQVHWCVVVIVHTLPWPSRTTSRAPQTTTVTLTNKLGLIQCLLEPSVTDYFN